MEYQEANEICLEVVEGGRWLIRHEVQDAVMRMLNELKELRLQLDQAELAHDTAFGLLEETVGELKAAKLDYKNLSELNIRKSQQSMRLEDLIGKLNKVMENG